MTVETKTRKNRGIQFIFALLALLFLIGIIFQVFIAGLAVFVDYNQWAFHRQFVVYFEFIPLVMLGLAFFRGIPKQWRWHCFGLYLMVALQYMTASVSIPLLTALHPIIALLLFWRAMVTTRNSFTLIFQKNI